MASPHRTNATSRTSPTTTAQNANFTRNSSRVGLPRRKMPLCMAADGRKFLQIAPWVSTIPCAAIFLVVLTFNVLGDALRDALDPKLRQ